MPNPVVLSWIQQPMSFLVRYLEAPGGGSMSAIQLLDRKVYKCLSYRGWHVVFYNAVWYHNAKTLENKLNQLWTVITHWFDHHKQKCHSRSQLFPTIVQLLQLRHEVQLADWTEYRQGVTESLENAKMIGTRLTLTRYWRKQRPQKKRSTLYWISIHARSFCWLEWLLTSMTKIMSRKHHGTVVTKKVSIMWCAVISCMNLKWGKWRGSCCYRWAHIPAHIFGCWKLTSSLRPHNGKNDIQMFNWCLELSKLVPKNIRILIWHTQLNVPEQSLQFRHEQSILWFTEQFVSI